MKKVIVCFLVLLATMSSPLAAQVNPQNGYIITNEYDTIYGTIDYLTDARNAKACLFKKKGESDYRSLSPSDIKGYRLADDGIYYVSRMFDADGKKELLFAEFLLQGGVSLYRYYHDDNNYFGFVDVDDQEVIIRDDKLNSDLGSYNVKLQDRRKKVQEINALMSRDNTIADRLWKMDLTSHDLTKLVKQYDERYCTESGDCIVFQYDKKKASAVKRRFYVGVGASFASYEAANNVYRSNLLYTGNTYSGIAPTFLVGADFLFPRFSRQLMVQVELSYTPHRHKASKEMLEGGNPKMSTNELAGRIGLGYNFCPDSYIRPFVRGGLHMARNSEIKEKEARFRYDQNQKIEDKTGDLLFDNETRFGLYLGAGVDIGHIRVSGIWKKAWSNSNGLDEKSCVIVSAAYVL